MQGVAKCPGERKLNKTLGLRGWKYWYPFNWQIAHF